MSNSLVGIARTYGQIKHWAHLKAPIDARPSRLAAALPTVLALAIANAAIAAEDPVRPIAFVDVSTYEKSATYSITPGNRGVRVTRISPQSTDSGHTLERVTFDLAAKKRTRVRTAQLIHGRSDQRIEWAELSPDNTFVFAGPEDPFNFAVTSGTIYRASGLAPLKRVEIADRLCDTLWSQDSKSVVLLEVTAEARMTPWGLLAALSGHPIQVHTFHIRILNLETGSDVRATLEDRFENAVATLRPQR